MSFLRPSGPHSSLFCRDCSSILELSSEAEAVRCKRCGALTNPANFLESVRLTESHPKVDFSEMLQDDEEGNDARATVQELCPKCGNGTAFFRTVQMRSADEGATVFYQCTECGHAGIGIGFQEVVGLARYGAVASVVLLWATHPHGVNYIKNFGKEEETK